MIELPKNNPEELKEYLATFKHKVQSKVKFEDVDAYGVVHNIKFLYWIEFARTEFMHDMFSPEIKGNFLACFPVMVVRNEVDYFDAMHFNDEYTILSRVNSVGTSSINFENIVLRNGKTPVVRQKSVFVHVDEFYKEKRPISDTIRLKIKEYKGNL